MIPCKGDKGNFIWAPSQCIQVVGSWADNSGVKGTRLDLAIEMPPVRN